MASLPVVQPSAATVVDRARPRKAASSAARRARGDLAMVARGAVAPRMVVIRTGPMEIVQVPLAYSRVTRRSSRSFTAGGHTRPGGRWSSPTRHAPHARHPERSEGSPGEAGPTESDAIGAT